MASKIPKARAGSEVVLVGLDEFWCSDCSITALFERVEVDIKGMVRAEWACINCGAAYMDAIDLASEPAITGGKNRRRGVA